MAGWLRSVVFIGMSGASLAWAADGPSCRTYDNAKPCCPHPPPICCPAPVSVGIDDAGVLAICGSATPKGEAAGIESCKRYYARGGVSSEVSFSRQAGGVAKFVKLRESLAGERSKVTPVTVVGASAAFLLRELDEEGKLHRSSAWGVVGTEVLSVEAESTTCDDAQVVKLLVRAIERVRDETAPRKAAAAATRPPG